MRIERELMVPAEMITAPDRLEMLQATVEVRWQVVAPTVEELVVVVVELGEVVTVDAMKVPGVDMEEIMTVEVEAAEETTEGKVREEGVIGGMTVGKEVEEEGKEVALMIVRTSSGQDVSSTRIVTLIWS